MMREKLASWYDEMYEKFKCRGGHAIGFYRECEEVIDGKYEFDEGIFTIMYVNGDFFCWKYDPKQNPNSGAFGEEAHKEV
jgi:hypothetical protein